MKPAKRTIKLKITSQSNSSLTMGKRTIKEILWDIHRESIQPPEERNSIDVILDQAHKEILELLEGCIPEKKGHWVIEAQDGKHWVEDGYEQVHNQAIDEIRRRIKEVDDE